MRVMQSLHGPSLMKMRTSLAAAGQLSYWRCGKASSEAAGLSKQVAVCWAAQGCLGLTRSDHIVAEKTFTLTPVWHTQTMTRPSNARSTTYAKEHRLIMVGAAATP